MLELIYILKAASIYIKDDAHYAVRGVNMKPIHEWCDEINAPLQDYIDEIKESYLLRLELEVPRGTEINAEAVKYIPQDNPHDNYLVLKNIRALLEMVNRQIDKAAETDAQTAGDNDMLGRLSTHVQHHIALLNMSLQEAKNENIDN